MRFFLALRRSGLKRLLKRESANQTRPPKNLLRRRVRTAPSVVLNLINLDYFTKIPAEVGGGTADVKCIDSEFVGTCEIVIQKFVPDITMVSLQTE